MTPDTTPDTYMHLFFGYSVIWGLIVFYLVALMHGQRKLTREIAELKNKRSGDEARRSAAG